MKKLGVVGVCIGGVEEFYPHIVRKMIVDTGDSPQFIVNQLEFSQVNHAFDEFAKGRSDNLISLILSAVELLVSANVDYVLIPNNAAHVVIDEVKEKSPIKVLTMFEAVEAHCRANHYSRVLTLGSKWVMEPGSFQMALKNSGLHTVNMNDSDIILIHDAIMEAMQHGSIPHDIGKAIIELALAEHQSEPYDAIVMACSDIVKLFKNNDVSIPTINTMKVYADYVSSLMV
ncbi:MAG: hypothetical protein CMF50_06945 [Legionellales bacterium]|nr:hypothetical protein [Legionellales bacterium]|tara:strand:+ start:241 stop:930 length:690 start_codon:yes stop_codon:yes gene_type:complete